MSLGSGFESLFLLIFLSRRRVFCLPSLRGRSDRQQPGVNSTISRPKLLFLILHRSMDILTTVYSSQREEGTRWL